MNPQSIDKGLKMIFTTQGQTEANKNISRHELQVNDRDATYEVYTAIIRSTKESANNAK